MTTTEKPPAPTAAVEGRITDEDIERAKAQIGIAVNQRDEAWNKLPQADAITHFAFGCGDDNPLFHDAEYGRGTRWHGQIAPPTFAIATGPGPDARSSPIRSARSCSAGCSAAPASTTPASNGRWYQPIYAGRPVLMEAYTLDVVVKESEFSGGRSVKETYRFLYVDADGNPIATRDESYINAERHGSKKSGKLAGIERQHWTEEEFAEVEAAYEAEERRGAEPQWWEDVNGR